MSTTKEITIKKKTKLTIEEEVYPELDYIIYRCSVKKDNKSIGHEGSVSIHTMQIAHIRDHQYLKDQTLFCLQRAIMAEMGESILPI